jgi:DNA polymerase III delta prime subunit
MERAHGMLSSVEAIEKALKNTTHHAYLLEGEKGNVLATLLDLLKERWDIDVKRYPDCILFDQENFVIDGARTLSHFVSGKALLGGKKILIVAFSSITVEAQNALLKVLEEPTAQTYFFLIVPTADILLPTVLSRLYRSALAPREIKKRELGESFLTASLPGRLQMVANIIKNKNREQALELVDSVEMSLRARGSISNGQLVVYKELEKARAYLYGRSPSVKMLLEHLLLIVPSHHRK